MMVQKFAWMEGAKRIIAVDYLDYRINHAKKMNNVRVFEFTKYPDMGEHLKEITHGGADVVIDCVGMDGKKPPLEFLEQKLGPIQISTKAVRKYGTVQMTGVYGGNYNLFTLGAFWVRNINLRVGQAPVIHFMPELFKKITNNEFDPRDIITHKMSLEEASQGYRIFNNREDESIKVVLKP
ncbi:UNVERIFIED_ORG: threonine dehydrogenase-like Zn-dependent dehydrogenase [Peribacillus simplex]